MNDEKLLDRLLKKNESESLDFKEEFKDLQKDFSHDVLSMYNTPIKGEKYIVYGVADNKEIVGIEKHLDSAKLNNFLATIPFNTAFSVQVSSITRECKKVSIVIIPENNIGPVVPKTDKYGLKKNHVYIRHGDTNTGNTETAEPRKIKEIYDLVESIKKTNYIETNQTAQDIDILNRHGDIHSVFHLAIRDYENWDKTEEFDNELDDHVETFFYKNNMDFIIKTVPHLSDFQEPWAQDACDPKAVSRFIQLRYKGIKINELIAVWTDGLRYVNMVPDQKFIHEKGNDGLCYYYFIKDSLKYDLNFLLNHDSNFIIDRFASIQFPVFNSDKEALDMIDKDYRSGERLLLSYEATDETEERYGVRLRKYKKYPIYKNGRTIPANK